MLCCSLKLTKKYISISKITVSSSLCCLVTKLLSYNQSLSAQNGNGHSINNNNNKNNDES